jgi:hypothetical protein
VTSKADEEKEGNTEGNVSSSSLRDYASDGSSSLSPPVLLPLQDVNSDFEETIEDPPDLELYHINHGKFSYFGVADDALSICLDFFPQIMTRVQA